MNNKRSKKVSAFLALLFGFAFFMIASNLTPALAQDPQVSTDDNHTSTYNGSNGANGKDCGAGYSNAWQTSGYGNGSGMSNGSYQYSGYGNGSGMSNGSYQNVYFPNGGSSCG